MAADKYREKAIVRVKCDLCSMTDKGGKADLGQRGWRKAVIWMAGKKETITRCPQHKEGYDEIIGNAFKKRLRLSTKIGGITIKGGAEMTGDITIVSRHTTITGDVIARNSLIQPEKPLKTTVSGHFEHYSGPIIRRDEDGIHKDGKGTRVPARADSERA